MNLSPRKNLNGNEDSQPKKLNQCSMASLERDAIGRLINGLEEDYKENTRIAKDARKINIQYDERVKQEANQI